MRKFKHQALSSSNLSHTSKHLGTTSAQTIKAKTQVLSLLEIQLELELYTVRNYLHGLQNSGESIEDSDLHTDFGPITW